MAKSKFVVRYERADQPGVTEMVFHADADKLTPAKLIEIVREHAMGAQVTKIREEIVD